MQIKDLKLLKAFKIYLFFAIIFLVQKVIAQNPSFLSNLRKKNIPVSSNSIKIDSLSIIPNSLQIKDVLPTAYKIDEVNATITWIHKPSTATVFVTYRVFYFNLNAIVKRFNYDSIKYNYIGNNDVKYNFINNQNNNPWVDFGNVKSEGSFGRGVSFGNSQDAVVNSSLNLQLNGYIGDSLQISAAITDNNIPIQPDGNTQNLNDFDKILLTVKKKGWQADFGDIDIKQNKNYYLNFYSRLQGASFTVQNKIKKDITNSLLVSGAVAKGKFTQNILKTSEGNQGPYRLQNANNDFYFIVLAGTEKVFIDGMLMQRGEDQDYVINYNTAELTFTQKHLITKDTRVQVQFEYSDKNFLNSQIYILDEIKFNKKFSLNIGAYNNIDAKNSPVNQILNTAQKQFLTDVGNGIDTAFYQSAQTDTFAVNKIQYKKIDTMYNNNVHDSIFTFTTNSKDVVYTLSFTNVGQGHGDYVLAQSVANGQVFDWVAPDANNVKQGNWAPVILLVTPKKQQIFSVGAEYFFSEKVKIKIESAISNYDVNLYSKLNKSADLGLGTKIQFISSGKKINIFSTPLEMETIIGYEFEQATFKPIERIRDVEFLRDWGLSLISTNVDEKILSAVVKITDKKNNFYSYNISNYKRSDNFDGLKNQFNSYNTIKGWTLANALSITTNNNSTKSNVYFKPSVAITKELKKVDAIQIGFNYFGEYNKERNKLTDTLTALSFAFNTFQASIKSSTHKKNNWGATFFTRNDFLPLQTTLVQANKSKNVNVFAELLKSQKRQLKFNITYRNLLVSNAIVSTQKADKSLLGRVEYNFIEWKGLFKGSALYELGSGQEQKQQYSFLQAPAGQGQYMWIDLNNNGIQELNEFVLAIFPDQKLYIKVFTPSGTYVKANYLTFNYSIDINPKAIIKSKHPTGLLKILYRSSTSSALQITKKDIATTAFEFNPFTKQLIDTTLLSLNSFLNNTLYYNKSNSKWGFDITQGLLNSKTLLSYGFESRTLKNVTGKYRWNFNKTFSGNFIIKKATNALHTGGALYNNNNYLIKQISTEPSISYIYKSNFRFALSYNFTNKKNSIDSLETVISNALSADLKFNTLSKGAINAKLTYNQINFKAYAGASNSTIGYVILDGLVPGKNVIWTINYTRKLIGNFEINLQYDGRKPGNTKVINVGRVSVRAIL